MTLDSAKILRAQGQHEGARELLVSLAAKSPNDKELQYQTASVHDFLGLEAQAVSYYLAALEGPLSGASLRGAFLGLGSTYRTLGKYVEAEATLRSGLAAFPAANDIKVFLAMVCHNLGRSKEAVESLLLLLAETSEDEYIRPYARAIEFYAQDIERAWPE